MTSRFRWHAKAAFVRRLRFARRHAVSRALTDDKARLCASFRDVPGALLHPAAQAIRQLGRLQRGGE